MCRAASLASACDYGQVTLASPPSSIQALACNGHPGEGDRWQGSSQPFSPARLLAHRERSLVFTTVVPEHLEQHTRAEQCRRLVTSSHKGLGTGHLIQGTS